MSNLEEVHVKVPPHLWAERAEEELAEFLTEGGYVEADRSRRSVVTSADEVSVICYCVELPERRSNKCLHSLTRTLSIVTSELRVLSLSISTCDACS
jgi:hypothetical protein